MKTAIYPGSFDPITLGHLNIIRRASTIFDRVVVCIMPNAGKLHPMFTREERVALAHRVIGRFPNVAVDTFDGLLAEYAKTFPEGAHWCNAWYQSLCRCRIRWYRFNPWCIYRRYPLRYY
mgnify:CR=1 FL=1